MRSPTAGGRGENSPQESKHGGRLSRGSLGKGSTLATQRSKRPLMRESGTAVHGGRCQGRWCPLEAVGGRTFGPGEAGAAGPRYNNCYSHYLETINWHPRNKRHDLTCYFYFLNLLAAKCENIWVFSCRDPSLFMGFNGMWSTEAAGLQVFVVLVVCSHLAWMCVFVLAKFLIQNRISVCASASTWNL